MGKAVKGHYAKFEYELVDGSSPEGEDRIRQVFCELVDEMPRITRGKNKGGLKATMILRVCVYGGATRNGDIARPDDIPEIWLVPDRLRAEDYGPIAEWACVRNAKDPVLYSGSMVEVKYPDGSRQLLTRHFERPTF